jgi:hypothetical protein
MSSITSSAYPVVSVSTANDQFTIVQNGQLKKLTRDGLTAFLQTIAPNTLIALSDTPVSYVGQQGKALVVAPGEEGMVFEAATAGNFLALSDTPVSYLAQAGKIPKVNVGETLLEFADNNFTGLGDTPGTYVDQSAKIVRVNLTGTALEFVAPFVAVPSGNVTGGWVNIDNNLGPQAYTATDTFVKILNNGAGTESRSDYAPAGVTDIYNEATSQFDFSQLSVGDMVTIRANLTLQTTAVNQEVTLEVYMDNGGAPFSFTMSHDFYKAAGAGKRLAPLGKFYIDSDAVKNNPVDVRLRSDANVTISTVSYTAFISRLGDV